MERYGKVWKGMGRYGKDFWFAIVDVLPIISNHPFIHSRSSSCQQRTWILWISPFEFRVTDVYYGIILHLPYYRYKILVMFSMKSLTNMLILVDPKTEIHNRNSGPSCLSPPCDAIGIGQVATSRAPNRRVAGETVAFWRIHWDLFR